MSCILHILEIDNFTDAKLIFIINMNLALRYLFVSSTAAVRRSSTAAVGLRLPYTAAGCVSCPQQPYLSRPAATRLDQKPYISSSSRTPRLAAVRLTKSSRKSNPATVCLVQQPNVSLPSFRRRPQQSYVRRQLSSCPQKVHLVNT